MIADRPLQHRVSRLQRVQDSLHPARHLLSALSAASAPRTAAGTLLKVNSFSFSGIGHEECEHLCVWFGKSVDISGVDGDIAFYGRPVVDFNTDTLPPGGIGQEQRARKLNAFSGAASSGLPTHSAKMSVSGDGGREFPAGRRRRRKTACRSACPRRCWEARCARSPPPAHAGQGFS